MLQRFVKIEYQESPAATSDTRNSVVVNQFVLGAGDDASSRKAGSGGDVKSSTVGRYAARGFSVLARSSWLLFVLSFRAHFALINSNFSLYLRKFDF